MMMPLVVTFVSIVALLRGGSLRNFDNLHLRWIPLAIGSFVLQLLIFTPFRTAPLISGATPQLYVLSMAMLTIWVGLNRRIPGMSLMAAGLLMNFTAIVANGGYMPVSPASARYAGTIANYASEGPQVANNSLATDSGLHFWLLTDIIPLPKELPFANVFSVGDLFLMTGVGILCYRTIRGMPEVTPASADASRDQTALAAADIALSPAQQPAELVRHISDEMTAFKDMLDQDIDIVDAMSAQAGGLEGPHPDEGRADDRPAE
jgi:hypothetical protein